MISLWNHPHHNCYPNPSKKRSGGLEEHQQRDYEMSSGGAIRRVEDEGTEIEFNSDKNYTQKTFIEKTNIHPLQPFVGDIMYQGRWGNSIRFSSTIKIKPSGRDIDMTVDPKTGTPTPSYQQNPLLLNDWSSAGKSGDPIIIIRNGQNPSAPNDSQKKQGWVPIIEDINGDLSSIYATSTQNIPIEVSNTHYDSFFPKPTKPNLYSSGAQVVINSDRLVFNAKKDSVLISANRDAFLGSNKSLVLNSPITVIDCLDIKLGDKTATEPIIKGDIFLSQLELVMKKLDLLCDALKSVKDWPNKTSPEGVINGALDTAVGELTSVLTNGKNSGFLDTIEDYKSKVSKTK